MYTDNPDRDKVGQALLLIRLEKRVYVNLCLRYAKAIVIDLDRKNDIYGYMTRCWINIERTRQANGIAVLFILASTIPFGPMSEVSSEVNTDPDRPCITFPCVATAAIDSILPVRQ